MYKSFQTEQSEVKNITTQIANDDLGRNKVEGKFLSIAALTDLQMGSLIEPDENYANSLRILFLRTLVKTKASDLLNKDLNQQTAKVIEFLGFENFEKFASIRTMKEIKDQLSVILNAWECEFGRNISFPPMLDKNLESLGHVANLSEFEKIVLGYSILLHNEELVDECSQMVGERISSFAVPRIYSQILGIDIKQIEKVLESDGNLFKSCLLHLDLQWYGFLRSRLELITEAFPKRMVVAQSDIRNVVKGFVTLAKPGTLSVDNYSHISERLSLTKQLFEINLKNKQSGVNVLIYGKPGTGKTEFSKLIAKEVCANLLEVRTCTSFGLPITKMRRMRSYQVGQSIYSQGDNIILFDECEEIFNSHSLDDGDNDPISAQKSWLNSRLETNRLPTIWISNSIESFDPAFLRRFDMVFEMPLPSVPQRYSMVSSLYGDNISDSLAFAIGKNVNISPDLVSRTAKIVNAVGQGKSVNQRNEITLMLVNDKLKAQGVEQIKPQDIDSTKLAFDVDMINSPLNLSALKDGLVKSKEGRICLYGPPGTGKTAFGKWLANSLGMDHMVMKGSDLLTPYVGETEQKIAGAFLQAKREKALLQFDEVDSFLHERGGAKQSWEVNLVNEMLTQMDQYDGVFIASTNRFDHLDEAAMRRFDISLAFDFMLPNKVQDLFLRTCQNFSLEVDEKLVYSKLANVRNITPGDFEQINRMSKFIQIRSANDLLDQLMRVSQEKKSRNSRTIGFL